MMRSVSLRYAARSLLRNPRRTVLSMIGIGVGCGIAIFATSWIGGSRELQIRAISESGGGHLRVVHEDWTATRENALRLKDSQRILDAISTLPGLEDTVARARTNGLLAFGNRTAGVEVVGVQPEAEQRTNRIVYKSSLEGRYLRSGDENRTVIGKALAKRLDVELDDDLMITLVGQDEIQSAMLRIVGILGTGSKDLDSGICHVTLDDIERLTGYEGPAELSVFIGNYRHIDARREDLAQRIPGGSTVITWREINPGLAGNAEGDTAFMNFMICIIVLVVSLGIASAQLTAVLERRTEFAILTALGMKARQVVGLVALEGFCVGVGGAVASLLLGGSGSYLLATKGVNLAAMMGEEMSVSFGDVMLDPYIYGEFGLWVLYYALAISVITAVVASAYPAWLTTRLAPANALRRV